MTDVTIMDIELTISDKNLSKIEIPTGNPLIIKLNKNLKIIDSFYLDTNRSKDLLIKL